MNFKILINFDGNENQNEGQKSSNYKINPDDQLASGANCIPSRCRLWWIKLCVCIKALKSFPYICGSFDTCFCHCQSMIFICLIALGLRETACFMEVSSCVMVNQVI